MSATRGKVEYRYWVSGTRLYPYRVVAELWFGLVRLQAPGGSEFHSTGDDEFKRTKKAAWAAAVVKTKERLAECRQEHKSILKRLATLERRLKIQQEKAKCTTK